MNPINKDRPISDDHRFDLLVDGELGEPERRELLSRLDDEPGGWRRCALAFLEGQSWRREFATLAREPVGQPSAGRPARRLLGRRGPAGTLLAMAASFLVALLLGGLVRGIRQPGSPAAVPPIGSQANANSPQTPPRSDTPAESPKEIPPEQAQAPSGKVWMVELPGLDGEGQAIRLPAFERDQVGDGWVNSLPAPVSPETLEQLRKAGLQVEHRRELLPLRMRDGRRLVVPVDNVDIHFVGNPSL